VAKKVQIMISGDMRVGNHTYQPANVRASARALQQAADLT
jgi:hypothetical protein